MLYFVYMKKAFTLIELLVVVAIISVLTAVVLTQFGTVRARARDAKRVSDIAQLQLAIQQYFDRCNQYPNATPSGTGPDRVLDINSTSSSCPTGVTMANFLNQLPTPPSGITDTSGTNPYTYRYIVHSNAAGINDDYYLVARLEQLNKALDDDIDGTIPASTAGWRGWSLTGTFSTINANDTADSYLYAVRSR